MAALASPVASTPTAYDTPFSVARHVVSGVGSERPPPTFFYTPSIEPGELAYYELDSEKHSDHFRESDEPQIEEDLRVVVPVEGEEYEFVVSTMVETMTFPEYTAPPTEVAGPKKKIVILIDDHSNLSEYVEEKSIQIPDGITVNMLNAAEPGQCNMFGNDEATDFVEAYHKLKNVATEDVILEQLKQLGRRKKKEYLTLLQRFGRMEDVDAGFTRFPGWEILYDVSKMPERFIQRDQAITYGIYIVDVDEGTPYIQGEKPWQVAHGELVRLSTVVENVIDAGYTHITFINVACADFNESLSDRHVRHLARKAKIMRQMYSTQVISTSPDFKIAKGTMLIRDERRAADRAAVKAKADAEEETRRRVLQSMKREADREYMNKRLLLKKKAEAHMKELEDIRKMNKAFSAQVEQAAMGAAEKFGGTRKKRYTKKQKRYKKRSIRKKVRSYIR